MSKNSGLYKYCRFTTLSNTDNIIFSYILSGSLQFINHADGCGIQYDAERGFGGGYSEFDIDLNIPQINEFDKVGRNPAIKILVYQGYDFTVKNKYFMGAHLSERKSKAVLKDFCLGREAIKTALAHNLKSNKPDFSSCFLSIPYAIKFLDNNQSLVCNSERASYYISKYSNLDLRNFIDKTFLEFSK